MNHDTSDENRIKEIQEIKTLIPNPHDLPLTDEAIQELAERIGTSASMILEAITFDEDFSDFWEDGEDKIKSDNKSEVSLREQHEQKRKRILREWKRY